MAQYRPDAPTLLAAVADVLDEVMGEVAPEHRHRVRVAAHLTRLVERELRLGPDADAAELRDLRALVGDDIATVGEGVERLAARLRASTDESFEDATRTALEAITRRDLDISKPGHTEWTGT